MIQMMNFSSYMCTTPFPGAPPFSQFFSQKHQIYTNQLKMKSLLSPRKKTYVRIILRTIQIELDENN
jgi:hypothetical protein